MSFDKHYPRRKDWRAPYRCGSKRFDTTCRPHGGCPYCERGRLIKHYKADITFRELKAEECTLASDCDCEQCVADRWNAFVARYDTDL